MDLLPHPQLKIPLPSDITTFAQTTHRNQLKPFGIKRADRRAHIYLLGKTGTGKSTLLETFMRDDLQTGAGFALLDPHGDLVQKIKSIVPEERQDDLIYFEVADPGQPYGFNPLSNIPESRRPLAASGLIQVLKHLWIDSWGPRLEHILRNCLLTLLDYPNANLSDILRLLADKEFRTKAAKLTKNQQVRDFWIKEYDRYPERFRVEAISPIQNKIGAFLSHPLLQKILTKPEKPLNLRRIMDEGKILLVNLAKGNIGEDTSNMLGSLLISRFDLAALSRVDTPEEERRDFTIYLDEFHNFTTQSLLLMLSELRKYATSLFAKPTINWIEKRMVREVRFFETGIYGLGKNRRGFCRVAKSACAGNAGRASLAAWLCSFLLRAFKPL
jgi:hypothetical protein